MYIIAKIVFILTKNKTQKKKYIYNTKKNTRKKKKMNKLLF
jgi:hypothetical protein